MSHLPANSLIHWLSSLLQHEEIDLKLVQNDICGTVLRHLYKRGETNSSKLLSDLLQESIRLSQMPIKRKNIGKKLSEANNENDEKRDFISEIADSLLCNIASYLNTKELFGKWNNISHKFIQIGLKRESIRHFDLTFVNICNLTHFESPKFRLNSILSNLVSLKLQACFPQLIDISKLKLPKTVQICMFYI